VLSENNEIVDECLSIISNTAPEIVESARMLERIEFFSKLRDLIHQKDIDNDALASDVLGWAYEKLSE
jgi:hypothetical protein